MEVQKSCICICKLKTQESWWHNSIWVQRPENQRRQWCKPQTEGRGWNEISQINQGGRQGETDEFFLPLPSVPFRLSIHWRKLAHTEKSNPFTKSANSSAILIWKHPHRHNQRWCLTLALGAHSRWHVKLTTWRHTVKKAMWRQRQRLERYSSRPGTPRSARSQHKVGGGWKTSSLETSENMALPTPWFKTSSPQNCQRIDFCCFTPPELWCFVREEIHVKKPIQRGSSLSMLSASLSWVAEPPLVPNLATAPHYAIQTARSCLGCLLSSLGPLWR